MITCTVKATPVEGGPNEGTYIGRMIIVKRIIEDMGDFTEVHVYRDDLKDPYLIDVWDTKSILEVKLAGE